ncbi:hypothetical protein GCM10027072_71870 [Streptomyces bullii]
MPTAEAATTAGPAAEATAARSATEPHVPGSTQSLPLRPLTRDRTAGAPGEEGLPARDVRRFSLVGVVWDDPGTELHGRVQVRTRAAATGTWSGWQDVETHNADHAADPDTPERTSGRVRGATAPLWVGDSDGVEVRVRAEPGHDHRAGTPGEAPTSQLPPGLRLELVDPGEAAPPSGTRVGGLSAEATAASAANADLAPLGATEIPAESPAVTEESPTETEQSPATTEQGPAATEQDPAATEESPAATVERPGVREERPGVTVESPATTEQGPAAAEREPLSLNGADRTERQAKPYIGPRPAIVTRRGWGANEQLREKKFVYTKKVKAAFVHHTASGNNYSCSQAPSLIRSIYRYHVKSMGWRDIGYNFVIDKCGRIYEGRAGGVAKPVLGAHTLGFNSNSMGIAVLGSFTATKPSSSAVKAIARLTAWKLGLHGMNPKGKTYLKSGGGNLYRKGMNVRLNVISGHRDGFATECPGGKLYRKLGSARTTAARYQGR